MSFVLNKDQELIQQSAREFARRWLKPMIAELDQTGEFPSDIVKLMAENDFLGMFLPYALGGSEAGYVSYLVVIEEISRVCAAVASVLANHSAAAYAIQRWGSEEQQQNNLPLLASGKSLGGFAVFENGPVPGEGTEALTATRCGQGYRLNGRKTYVGNAGVANIYVAVARGAEAGTGSTAFLVAAGTPGLAAGPVRGRMGLRGYPIADLFLHDVMVEETNILGVPGTGEIVAEGTLAATAVAEAAQTVGIMETALEEAAEYARQRVQFGQPIVNFEAVQSLLAEAMANCHVARLAAYDAARLISSGEPFLREAAIAKWFCARHGPAALINAIQVEGGYGYSEETPLARLYRDIWGTTISEPPANFPEGIIAGNRS